MTRITRDVAEPIRQGLSWRDLWEGPDLGLIACWEAGRSKSPADPVMGKLIEQCRANELPVLPWTGGVVRKIKGAKFGALEYVAMWQGLRGEALDVETEGDTVMTCARTGMQVTFGLDRTRLGGVSVDSPE